LIHHHQRKNLAIIEVIYKKPWRILSRLAYRYNNDLYKYRLVPHCFYGKTACNSLNWEA